MRKKYDDIKALFEENDKRKYEKYSGLTMAACKGTASLHEQKYFMFPLGGLHGYGAARLDKLV